MSGRAELTAVLLACLALMSGCSGEQSVLDPKGESAQSIRLLANFLFLGGGIVLATVIVATTAALWGPDKLRRALSAERAIVIGGIAFPTVVLTALLVYGVLAMSPNEPATKPIRIMVEGKQWWWRVRYEVQGRSFETANEIRMPVDRPVEFVLTSSDVIHSFWVPNLAGKIDMLPGRTTRLAARATQTGTMRGQCAEFCGGPHGLMSLRVVAMESKAFDAWAARDRKRNPDDAGHRLFVSVGCGGCHSVEGTEARGRIGPDLTDVGARAMLAAETLPNSNENISRWILSGQSIKPENTMPEFKHLQSHELATLSAYLTSLK
jgi:cytochrome c oxidase subunit 2